jgi:hypothetical protein
LSYPPVKPLQELLIYFKVRDNQKLEKKIKKYNKKVPVGEPTERGVLVNK